MLLTRRKQFCVDCHFCVKEVRSMPTPAPFTLEITEKERDLARKADYGWQEDYHVLACSFGVWDEGHNFNRAERHQTLAQVDRRAFCFFWHHRPGMLLPAAKILQEREASQHEAARDRKLTIYGLWIAAGALVLDLMAKLADRFHWWPFN